MVLFWYKNLRTQKVCYMMIVLDDVMGVIIGISVGKTDGDKVGC